MEDVYAEVYEVLRSVPEEKFYKVPKKLTNFFEKYKGYGKGVKIDLNKRFAEQDISQKAKDIIFCISLNYWLSDEEKDEVVRKMKINEKEYREKYSVDNLFNKINGKNI